MTELELFRDWVKTYPGMPPVISVDHSDAVPDTGSLIPGGVTEVSRTEDVLGNLTVDLRADFKITFTFTKTGGDDETALRNAVWLAGFQEWVGSQSALGLAPAFGNCGRQVVRAEKGSADSRPDHGLGLYSVNVSVRYQVRYRADNN